MNNYIKFPGVFKPGLTDVQYITEAQYVKGSYIVLDTIADRDALAESILVQGLLVYVNETSTEYRYLNNEWVENVPAFDDAPVDGKIYGRKDGQWVVVEIDTSDLEEAIRSFSEDLEIIVSRVDELAEGKADVTYVDDGLNRVADYAEECVKAVETSLADLTTKLEEKADKEHTHNIADIEGYEPTNLEGYATEDFVAEEIAKSTENLASKDFVTSEIGKAQIGGGDVSEEELTNLLANYYTKTESYNKDEIDAIVDGIEIPTVPTNVSEFNNDAGYITLAEVPETDLSDYSTTEQVKEYVQEEISNIDIPEVDTSKLVSVETFETELVKKANNIPFESDMYVGVAFGGFSKDDSVKGLTIKDILTTLLQLSENKSEPDVPPTPDNPDSVITDIIENEHPMYSVNADGQLVAHEFEVITMTPSEAAQAPAESCFYQIVDNGEVVESGYQDLQIINDEKYYVVALPKVVDYDTMVELQVYDDDENKWNTADKLPLTSDPATVAALCDEAGIDTSTIDTNLYTIWVLEDICTGSKLRYIIKE